jgi:hypothetical protein
MYLFFLFVLQNAIKETLFVILILIKDQFRDIQK